MKSKINKKVIKNAIVALDDVISSESDSDLISPPTGVEEVNKVAETFRCCSNCLYSEVDDPEHVHADLCNIRSSTEVKRRFINKFCGLYEVTPEYRMLNTWGKHKNKNGDCPYYDSGADDTNYKTRKVRRSLSSIIESFTPTLYEDCGTNIQRDIRKMSVFDTWFTIICLGSCLITFIMAMVLNVVMPNISEFSGIYENTQEYRRAANWSELHSE
jgi:hypothetical protein